VVQRVRAQVRSCATGAPLPPGALLISGSGVRVHCGVVIRLDMARSYDNSRTRSNRGRIPRQILRSASRTVASTLCPRRGVTTGACSAVCLVPPEYRGGQSTRRSGLYPVGSPRGRGRARWPRPSADNSGASGRMLIFCLRAVKGKTRHD